MRINLISRYRVIDDSKPHYGSERTPGLYGHLPTFCHRRLSYSGYVCWVSKDKGRTYFYYFGRSIRGNRFERWPSNDR